MIGGWFLLRIVGDNTPDPKKIDPLLLAGHSYRKLGGVAGAAFSAGKVLIKKP